MSGRTGPWPARVLLACALTFGAAHLPDADVPLAPGTARAVDLDFATLDRLEAEGTEWFKKSGDPDNSRTKRNEALREAYTRLRSAWTTLNAFCDAHPDRIEEVDARMVRINKLYYWVKKMAPMGVLGIGKPAGASGRKPNPGGNKDDAGSGPEPVGKTPAPKTEVPRPASPSERARAYENSRPGDLSGAMTLWLEALGGIDDTASPEYAEALERVSALQAELKDAYRETLDDDPDAIDVEHEPGQEAAVAERLIEQLAASDVPGRTRAAAQLGALGYTPAASALYQAARTEKDDAVRGQVFGALVQLGGKRTCETLSRFSRQRDEALAAHAVTALGALGKKGSVQGRYAGLSLGEFVALSKSDDVARSAIGTLRALGAVGVPGLVRGLDTKSDMVELEAIGALGEAADVRGAPELAKRLLAKGDEAHLTAAREAIRKIGRPAVPALIAALRTQKTRRYAGIALYDLTGETFGEDAKKWAAWWRKQE